MMGFPRFGALRGSPDVPVHESEKYG
jgi:hypothetical protein